VIMTTMASQTRDRTEDLVGIREAAEFLNRRPATLRMWEREGKLPKGLRPRRNSRGWREWTKAQLEEIKREWMPKHAVQGSGLPHYEPDPEEMEKRLAERRLENEDVS